MWYLTCPGVLTIVREILVSIIGGICCERLVIGVKKTCSVKLLTLSGGCMLEDKMAV